MPCCPPAPASGRAKKPTSARRLSEVVLADAQADRLRFDRAQPIKASASGAPPGSVGLGRADLSEAEEKHHEIYFSDFRKTDPSKLRTILRQPVTAAPL